MNSLIVSLQLNHYFQRKKLSLLKYFVRLPFLGALLLQILNKLKAFLRKHTDDKASVYIVDTFSEDGENFRSKNRQPVLMKSE